MHMFTDASCPRPSPFTPHSPGPRWGPGSALAAVPGLWGHSSSRLQPRFLQLNPSAVCAFRESPLLLCTGLTLITGLHCCACVQGDIVQPWESTPTARPLWKKDRCTCGPAEGLGFCHCTASPSCRALWSPGLVPVAGYHCAAAVVRSSSQGLHHDSQGTCSCQHTCSWLQPFLSVLFPTTTCVYLSTSPCHFTGPCSWGCAYHELQPSLLPALVSGC